MNPDSGGVDSLKKQSTEVIEKDSSRIYCMEYKNEKI